MRAHRSVFVLVVLLSVVPAQDTPEPASLAARMKADFAWFDTLGFPDVAGLKHVRVATGGWTQTDGNPPEKDYTTGFLLKEDQKSFTVLTHSLNTRSYVKKPAGEPEITLVGHAPDPLERYALSCLQRLRKPAKDEWHRRMRFGPHLPQKTETFVLARHCARQKLNALAHDLYAEAVRIEDHWGNREKKSLRQIVADDLATRLMWETILKFGDPDVGRDELLAAFKRIAAKFGDSEHAERARKSAELLERMIAEDKRHAAKPLKPFDKMTTAERVAELIFQLRNQNGQQWSQPGACDIFYTDDDKEDTPAHQLVAIGYEAVPQLINALDDGRFTRSVGYGRDFYFSHHVLRVGDCARQVINRIAARYFTTRGDINAWWKEFQKKGERRMLIEGTVRGDRNATSQAEKLLEKYPNDFLAAAKQGARRADAEWVRAYIVTLTGRMKGDAPVPFLLEELTRKSSPLTRMSAARALRRRCRGEATPAMIREWQRLPKTQRDTFDDTEGSVAEYLVHCNELAAMRAVADAFAHRRLDVRIEILRALDEEDAEPPYPRMPGATEKEEAERDGEIEKLLVHALTHRGIRDGMSIEIGGVVFSDPRLCDLAAALLAKRWPDRYAFDPKAFLRERDRRCIELANTWRTAHGIEPLPVPKQTPPPRLPDRVTRPLIKALLDAPSAAERARAVAALESQGLGALAAVRKQLTQLPAEHPARNDLEALTRGLSCIVNEVAFSRDSLAPGRAFPKRIEEARGQPLAAKRIVDLIRYVALNMPREANTIDMVWDRGGDGSGVRLEIMLTSERLAPRGDSQCNVHENVTLGRRKIHNRSLLASLEGATERNEYKDLIAAVDRLLAASPDTPFVIHVEVELNRGPEPGAAQAP